VDGEPAALQVGTVDVGDFVLPARRRLDAAGNADDVVVVEYKPGTA